MAAIPFLKTSDEAEATQRFAMAAIVVITFALAGLSVSGVLATTTWSWASIVPILFFAFCVTGAEALAAVSLVRVLVAGTLLRKIAGSIIFVGLAWVCVQNAKNGVHFIFPDRFAESSGMLAAKSELAGEEAGLLAEAAAAAQANSGAELERVRTQIADQEAFLFKMSAMTPEGIKEAQSEMIGRCGYQGRVDGIRSVLTESAMRTCGERINRQLDVLRQRETNLASGAATPVQDATTDRRLLEIETKAAADAAFWSAVWLEVMLWVLEGARSLGLWVFVVSMTGRSVNDIRKLEDEIKMAELRSKLRDFQIGDDPVIPKEDPAVDDSIVVVSSPPISAHARKGGQAAQHARRAAKNQRKVPVTDDRAEDVMFSPDAEAAPEVVEEDALDLTEEAVVV